MIVVDSAAVVDALTMVDDSDELRAVLAGGALHAPSLLDFEVVSALRGLTLGGKISAARAGEALADFDALPIERWPSAPPLRRRAFDLREKPERLRCRIRGARRGAAVPTADQRLTSRTLRRAQCRDLGPLRLVS